MNPPRCLQSFVANECTSFTVVVYSVCLPSGKTASSTALSWFPDKISTNPSLSLSTESSSVIPRSLDSTYTVALASFSSRADRTSWQVRSLQQTCNIENCARFCPAYHICNAKCNKKLKKNDQRYLVKNKYKQFQFYYCKIFNKIKPKYFHNNTNNMVS